MKRRRLENHSILTSCIEREAVITSFDVKKSEQVFLFKRLASWQAVNQFPTFMGVEAPRSDPRTRRRDRRANDPILPFF